METMSLVEKASDRIRSSVLVKAIGIGIIVLLLLIPGAMVESLVRERKFTYTSAVDEICSKWGSSQTITGPVVTIPFYFRTTDSNGKPAVMKKYAHFLPSELNINGKVDPEIRNRSIYKAILYKGNLDISGSFGKLNYERLKIDPQDMLFEEAFLSVGISDLRGISRQVTVNWDGDEEIAEPGIPVYDVISSGVNIPLDLSSHRTGNVPHTFKLNLALNGSRSLSFLPMGKETNVQISSPWASPSFDGAFLPTERNITQNGFEAKWSVLELNRTYPQEWIERAYTENSAFGFSMIIPVDYYQTITRSVKYALLFIVLTFAAFFTIEILKSYRVHPIQYVLIGFALTLFYALLLSFSERIGFGPAYLIASAGIVVMVTLYSMTITKSNLMACLIGAVLSGLYGFLYLLLQLEDYALLMGSIGLFVILGTFMFLTRNIDWYGGKKKKVVEEF